VVLRPHLLAAATAAVLLAATPHAQQGGAIIGRIDTQPVRAEPIRPNIGELTASRRVASEPRRSVVYLETAPQAAFETPPARRARMDQRDETFVPHVLPITVGTMVDFPNSDPTFHNVFSISKARSFDLGRYAAGKSKSVLFDRPGIVRVFCDIHSHMNAWILVFAHRFFSLTDDEGRYRIEGMPPGSYTVSVWNEAFPARSRTVVVGSGPVEVNMTLGSNRGSP
jgi:plastocyanin